MWLQHACTQTLATQQHRLNPQHAACCHVLPPKRSSRLLHARYCLHIHLAQDSTAGQARHATHPAQLHAPCPGHTCWYSKACSTTHPARPTTLHIPAHPSACQQGSAQCQAWVSCPCKHARTHHTPHCATQGLLYCSASWPTSHAPHVGSSSRPLSHRQSHATNLTPQGQQCSTWECVEYDNSLRCTVTQCAQDKVIIPCGDISLASSDQTEQTIAIRT